jgi:alkanesulfonate monooxygenase SsuD/methylene tetrahydromethanopterin reductase-like flavin-dependent oxidoreductase (luciferase family)
VGRDYNTILKTKLSTIVIDEDKEGAKRRMQNIFNGIPDEQIREFVIYGDPDDILKQIEDLQQEGIQYIIANFEPAREQEAMDIFAKKIIGKTS